MTRMLFKSILMGLAAHMVACQVPIGSFITRFHLVAGEVFAVSDRVLLIRNFVHDGQAPAVFFWADTNQRPSRGGYILLDAAPTESCGTESLGVADGTQDYIVEFPEGTSLNDILGGSISVWCERFAANFGEVRVPATLPGLVSAENGPSLACADAETPVVEVPEFVATPEGYNCEPLNDDYQVRWKVDGDNLNVELLGRIDDGVWMGFGVSGRDTDTFMVGADPVVADLFNGVYRARDFYLSAQGQCALGNGVCPESDNGLDSDTSNVSGDQDAGMTVVRYTRPLTPTNVGTLVNGVTTDRSISVAPGVSTFVVWALGPTDDDSGLPFFHSIGFPRVDVSIEFGRTVQDNCEPLVEPSGGGEEAIPFFRPILTDVTEFTARIGQSGGNRGYKAITGRDAWGIAWYINDALVPLIEMRRGMTYRFLVNGGDDVQQNSEYHPLYLTSSVRGGFAQFYPSTDETVFAGIDIDPTGFEVTAAAPLCEYKGTAASLDAVMGMESFPDYFSTLDTSCAENSAITDMAAVLEFTPDETTPDLIYYQCVTHRSLGFEIHVIDADAPSLLDVDCSALSETTVKLAPLLTLNAIINPNDNTLEAELVYEGIGWVAMAFTANQTVMIGAEAVIGLPDAPNSQNNPGKYNLNAKSEEGVVLMPESQQTLTDASIEQNATHTVLKFTKLLVETGEHPIDSEQANTFVWAFGTSNDLAFHAQMGGTTLLPPQCTVTFNGAVQNEGFMAPKQEAPPPPPPPLFCFSGSSLVNVQGDNGITAVPMRQLKIGDMVETGIRKFEPIYSFGHSASGKSAEFLQITTTSGSSLQLSADHMVFDKKRGFVPASILVVGDVLRGGQGENLTLKSIQTTKSTGIYAPFTPSGQIVVNNMLASTFVAFENNKALDIVGGLSVSYQWLAHTFEFPHRVACYYLAPCAHETYIKDGISAWVAGPLHAAQLMLEMPHGILKSALLIIFVLVLVIFSFVESVFTNPISFLVTIVALLGFSTRALKKTKNIL